MADFRFWTELTLDFEQCLQCHTLRSDEEVPLLLWDAPPLLNEATEAWLLS